MIIACPACHTRYVVPDGAIGVEGRTVRCAKCKHSWFQDGHGVPDAAPVPAPAPAPAPRAETPVAPASPAPPAPRPLAEAAAPSAPVTAPEAAAAARNAESTDAPDAGEGGLRETATEAATPAAPPVEEAPAPAPAPAPRDFDEVDPPFARLPDDARPTYYEDEDEGVSRFDHAPPFRPRRNMVRIWTWAAGIFAALALGAVVLVNVAGLPDWVPVPRPLFGAGPAELKLDFPVAEQERRTLPNGTEFFGARIRVTNSARSSVPVPDILIVLRDERERQVYSWVVAPPQSSLAPGETMTINEAVTDVPRSAVFADIGWAPR